MRKRFLAAGLAGALALGAWAQDAKTPMDYVSAQPSASWEAAGFGADDGGEGAGVHARRLD